MTSDGTGKSLADAADELTPIRTAEVMDSLRVEVEQLRVALDWAIDMVDHYDHYLAAIDGPEIVYSRTHLDGKAKARAALALVGTAKERARCGTCGAFTPEAEMVPAQVPSSPPVQIP